MGYEIDFLPVGEGEKSGDAIAIRYGDLIGPRQQQRVIIIDGGYQSNGEAMVEFIREHYKTDLVDLVISTHPDNDHICGLPTILEELQVKQLWMHMPWNYDSEVKAYVRNQEGRIQKEKLRKSLSTACELESVAKRKGIEIIEPFVGCNFEGTLYVLSPTQEFYRQQVCRFRGQSAESKATLPGIGFIREAKEKLQLVAEYWGIETLTDSGETSPENESSTILLFQQEEKRVLLTADAGQLALTEAVNLLDSIGFDWDSLRLIQVPHHGSQRNVGPTVLDRILGPKRTFESNERIALASVAPEGEPKHPSKKVTNAFRRRGAPVHVTKGSNKYHWHGESPNRGWGTSEPLPFYNVVED